MRIWLLIQALNFVLEYSSRRCMYTTCVDGVEIWPVLYIHRCRTMASFYENIFLFVLQALCEGNPPQVNGGFPHKGPITCSCDVFFHIRLQKRLNKQWSCRWFETSWHLCSVTVMGPLHNNTLQRCGCCCNDCSDKLRWLNTQHDSIIIMLSSIAENIISLLTSVIHRQYPIISSPSSIIQNF